MPDLADSSHARKLSRRLLPFAGLLLALLLATASGRASESAASETPRAIPFADSTTEFEKHYGYTGEDQWQSLPDGVTGVDIAAVGGWGATISAVAGGRPHRVKARLRFNPHATLYLVVGGNGSSPDGGFNGGGDGSAPTWTTVDGGGGGGASDVRTLPSNYVDTLASRVLVAAGGGGAGGMSLRTFRAGGKGGDAGTVGSRGANATAENTVGSGGFGGEPGTLAAGGTGGVGGFLYPEGGSTDGSSGASGALLRGGRGGDGADNSGSGMGGGGGGGYYGGGGGGGGMFHFFNSTEYFSGGGGGGGGSSLAPPGGSVDLADDEEEPRITLSYTIPGTEILAAPPEQTSSASVRFEIASTEAGAALECSLDADDSFEPCEATVEFEDLAPGMHTFKARSINPMGNHDPTPAVWQFRVDLDAPQVTIDSGPTGQTTDPRPSFGFRKPGRDVGHRPARIKVGKPRLRSRSGVAIVPVRVSGPGRLRLLGNRRVRPVAVRAKRATTVRLRVAPRRRFIRRLARQGRLAVKFRIRFDSARGGRAVRARTLTLRRVKRGRAGRAA